MNDDELRAIQQRCHERAVREKPATKLSTSSVPSKSGGLVLPPYECPRFDHADLPPRYVWTLEDYNPKLRPMVEKFFADGGPWSLYLYGQVGTRKSSLAAAIVRAWRLRFAPGADGTTAAWFAPMEMLIPKLRDSVAWAMDLCGSTQLLVLDDLGSARSTPHVLEQLLFVVKRRYDRKSKTVVTSNLNFDELGESMDRRIADRFREGMAFHCGDESKRAPAK